MTDHADLIAEARAEGSLCHANGRTEAGDLYEVLADALEAADARLATADTVIRGLVDCSGYQDNVAMPPICTGCHVQSNRGVIDHAPACVVALAERWLAEGEART